MLWKKLRLNNELEQKTNIKWILTVNQSDKPSRRINNMAESIINITSAVDRCCYVTMLNSDELKEIQKVWLFVKYIEINNLEYEKEARTTVVEWMCICFKYILAQKNDHYGVFGLWNKWKPYNSVHRSETMHVCHFNID